MKDKVWETITQYDMLQQGDRVVAALSGGADSMALLAFLLELKEPLGIGVSACHVNHGLRGEESDRDEAFVRDWCRRLEVPLQVVRLEGEALRREKGGSLEEAARRARYQALEKAAAGGKIATGHTASDNLETILLNLARGTGLRGLCGIPPVRGRIIRPLIALTRREVEQYCAARAIPYCTDSTNHSREYSRNRLRQQAVPALLSVNPAAERLAGEMSVRLRREDAFLDRLAREALARLEVREDTLDRPGLLREDPVLQARVLGLLLDRAGAAWSSRRLELAMEAARQGAGGVELAPGRTLLATPRWVTLRREEEPVPCFSLPLPPLQAGERVEIATPVGMVVLELSTNPGQNSEKINNCPLKNELDYDRIGCESAVRTRLPGDAFRPAGRGMTKTLKKLYQEEGVPSARRQRNLILCDRQGILWVEGIGPDQRAAPTSRTRRWLMIAVRPWEGGRRGVEDSSWKT